MAPWKSSVAKEHTQKSFSSFLWKQLLSHNLLNTILNTNNWGGISPYCESHHKYLSALLMHHHFWPIFGAGMVPCYVLNSNDQNFTCQRASSSAMSKCPWFQLLLRSWSSSSWRWGSVWKGSFCPTCKETTSLHLYICFSEHVSVGRMKCHSLGVLCMSYKFTLFPGEFHDIHSCQLYKVRMWKTQSCQPFLFCPKGVWGYHTYSFLCVSCLTFPCFLSLFPVR